MKACQCLSWCVAKMKSTTLNFLKYMNDEWVMDTQMANKNRTDGGIGHCMKEEWVAD